MTAPRSLVDGGNHHGSTAAIVERRKTSYCHSPRHSSRRKSVRENLFQSLWGARQKAQFPQPFPTSRACTLDHVFAPIVLLRRGGTGRENHRVQLLGWGDA